MKQIGFFDVDERLRRVSDLGDPLEVMAKIIDFEGFRLVLDEALVRSDRSKGGRPPFDPVVRLAHSDRWRSGPHCSGS